MEDRDRVIRYAERIAHLETLIRGHETNTRLFRARIDALIAEARNLRVDLAAAIRTGEELHCFRRDVSITLGLGKEAPTIDEVRAAIRRIRDERLSDSQRHAISDRDLRDRLRATETDLREAIKTGEEQALRIDVLRRDREAVFGRLAERTAERDEFAAEIVRIGRQGTSRLSRLDALLSSDEPPEGLRDWMSRLKPGPMPMTGAERAWRWFRQQFGEKHS